MTTRLTLVPDTDTDLEDQISATLATSPKVDHALRLLRGGASLHRVIAVGRYRNSWTPAEARWIKKHYIDDAPLDGEWRPSVYTPRPTRGVTRPVATLTPRQAGVLDGLCRGLDAADIADEHGLTRNTVQYHIRGIVRLLDAVTPGHAATLARTGQVRLLIVDNRSGRPMAARSAS
jgi:DNA-binding NarL/FixJ family response regulator